MAIFPWYHNMKIIMWNETKTKLPIDVDPHGGSQAHYKHYHDHHHLPVHLEGQVGTGGTSAGSAAYIECSPEFHAFWLPNIYNYGSFCVSQIV